MGGQLFISRLLVFSCRPMLFLSELKSEKASQFDRISSRSNSRCLSNLGLMSPTFLKTNLETRLEQSARG